MAKCKRQTAAAAVAELEKGRGGKLSAGERDAVTALMRASPRFICKTSRGAAAAVGAHSIEESREDILPPVPEFDYW